MSFSTYSPWVGCIPKSRGCKNCYIQNILRMVGVKTPIKKTHQKDVLLNTQAYRPGDRVFLCPLSDFFLEAADEWRDEIWSQVKQRTDIIFFIQTKRITHMHNCLPKDWDNGYDNVYINATIDDPHSVDERMSIFTETPIKHRVVALTPLTCHIDIERWLKDDKIQQAYSLGEIGCGDSNITKYVRECRYEWAKDLSDQFRRCNVHFDFKATGTKWVGEDGELRVIEDMRKQFTEAQKLNLSVKGKNEDYEVVFGVNHLNPVDFMNDKSSQACIYGGKIRDGLVFY